MYAFIRGTVVSICDGAVVLENNQIGYQIFVTSSTVNSLKVGEDVTLQTYLYVKEDIFMLYGFNSLEEKHFFEKLLTISGIGAKSAIQVLDGYPLNELIGYIVSENISMLTKIKGLGKKTAERIVLELKEQFKNCATADSNENVKLSSDGEDAVIALLSLGLSHQDAKRAVAEASKETSGLENIIALALKRI